MADKLTRAQRDVLALKRAVERRTVVYLWGQRHRVVPRLVSEQFGDGKQLLRLGPIIQRPNYYVVCIDSRWDISESNNPFRRSVLRDYLDDIYDAIKDEYGEVASEDEMREWPCGGCGLVKCKRCCAEIDSWPKLNLECGCEWDNLDWASYVGRRALESTDATK